MPSAAAAEDDHPLRRMINDVSNSRTNNNAWSEQQQNINQANLNNDDDNNNMDDHNNNANNNNNNNGEGDEENDDSSDDSQRTQTNNDPNWPFIFHSPTDDNNNGLAGGAGDDLLMDMDPFNVDSYKLLHTPGYSQCRGRNILSVLNDRSYNGPRFRNGGYYFGNADVGTMSEGENDEGNDENDAMDIQQQQEEEEVTSTPIQEDKSEPPSTPTLPPINLSTPGAASTTNDNTINNNNDQSINNHSYLSPPPPQNQHHNQQNSQNNQFQTPSNSVPNSPSTKIHGENHSSTPSTLFPFTTSNNNNESEIPSNPTDVMNEITSFAEFAAATKFKASYLRHLNGGLALPVRPVGGNGGNNRGASRGGRSSGMMTMEQLDTSRQLQQHLRVHNVRPAAHPSAPSAAGGRGGSGGNNPAANRGNNSNNNNNNVPMRQIHQQLGRQPHPQHQQQQHAAPPLNNHRNNNNNHHHQQQRSTNPINPNPAVSTISISFSPDARTLASTHGDHTVKITCCHTGKLLRQLEGHPRTPWTVKYHPTNARIVASGCLGFQVRVWDWNYQKESLRKERRLEREKRWRGRYDGSHCCGGGAGMRMNAGCDQEGYNMMGGGGGCVDSADYLGKSPRGVVEHPWRQSGSGGVSRRDGEADDNDDEDGGTDCANSSQTNSWGLPSHMTIDENDDYAAYALAEAGIPPEDPAWYDTEADAFDYDSGIGVCLNMIRLQSAVISLSFHPSGEMLAMASGSTLHLWDYNGEKRKRQAKAAAAAGGTNALTGRPISSTVVRESEILNRSENANFSGSAQPGQTMEFRHDSALRCVHFPPCGSKLIVGGVNPPSHNEGLPNHRANDPRRGRGGMSGGGMSFHLRIFYFDLDAVVNPSPRDGPLANARIPRGGRISDDGELAWNYQVIKEALNNPRTIIPRVLLYNDGGFDLSKDGTILSACADFWLPDGVDNAMDLVRSQQQMEEEAKQKQQHHSTSSPTGDHYSPGGGSDSLASSPVMSGIQGNFSSPPPRQMPPSFADPRTPPPNFSLTSLEPPSPPGKRNIANMPRGGQPAHTPHPLSVVAAGHPANSGGGGRYVPHIVTVSLDTTPPPGGEPMPLDPKIVRTEGMRRHPKLGQLLMAAPLDGAKSSGVTCVKLSPSSEYVLLGYGVRENIPSVDDGGETRHPVTSLYNVKKGMKHVCTLTCADDDVNIARFHPESGHGFVYGTKQGRVRVLSKRPWNYYHLNDD